MIYALAVIVVGVVVAFATARLVRRQHEATQAAAIAAFAGERPRLGEMFRSAAEATGKPRGLRWKACELDDRVLFGRDRQARTLYALAGATISFEAIAGGDMEDVEAVGNLRSATAVFVYRDGNWTTDGRAVFNLDPAAALARFDQSIEPIPEASGVRTG